MKLIPFTSADPDTLKSANREAEKADDLKLDLPPALACGRFVLSTLEGDVFP